MFTSELLNLAKLLDFYEHPQPCGGIAYPERTHKD
jgi:hypothetical protein